MWKATRKVFDGEALQLDMVGEMRRINTVVINNNTPFFLYVGLEKNVDRETAIFVVEPYSDVVQPVGVAQHLYVREGLPVGIIPTGCQAHIQWGSREYDMSLRKYHRNAVFPIFRGKITGAVSIGFTAQDLGGGKTTVTATTKTTEAAFAIPAGAVRRTIYVQFEGGRPSSKTSSLELQGSLDGGLTWFTLLGLLDQGEIIPIPNDVALPPMLRIHGNVTETKDIKANIWGVIDL